MTNPPVENNTPPSPMTSKRHRNVPFYTTKTVRLLCMLMLTFSFFIVEIVVGNMTNSLALVADAFHMLSDIISLLIGLVAVRIAKRSSSINTYGWVRAEVVGANTNTVFLLALCLTIVFDTIKRMIQPEPIVNVNLLLIVGCIGLGINLIGLLLFQGFHGHSHGGKGHEHSHGGESHGNTVHATDCTRTSSTSRTRNKCDEDTMESDETKSMVAVDDDGFRSLKTVIESTGLKRHSGRALEEV